MALERLLPMPKVKLTGDQVAHIQATVEKNVGFIKGLAEGRHPAMAQAMSGRA